MSFRVARSVLFLLFLLTCLFVTSGCEEKKEEKAPVQAAPVSVYKVLEKDIPYYLTAIGSVTAIETINVRSKVTGFLKEVYIKPGDFVQKGQLLCTIDPSEFEAEIRLYKSQLASNMTAMEQARRDYKRYEKLVESGSVSRESFEQKRMDFKQSQDSVSMTKANLANAVNNLSYCRIISPIAGRAGYIFPTLGQLVRENEDTIVTINQISPIYVDFYLPQKYVNPIFQAMQNSTLKVLSIIDGVDSPEVGELTFFDNQVDKETGTIWLKGTFPNECDRLWPGDFVQTRLQLRVDKDALIIPFEATCRGPEGTFVWVVNSNSTAQMKPVTIARRTGKWDVVAKGLDKGETVVTDGQLRLYDGVPVEIKKSADAREEPQEQEESCPVPPRKSAATATTTASATSGNQTNQ